VGAALELDTVLEFDNALELEAVLAVELTTTTPGSPPPPPPPQLLAASAASPARVAPLPGVKACAVESGSVDVESAIVTGESGVFTTLLLGMSGLQKLCDH
jgi:hypothetical protein